MADLTPEQQKIRQLTKLVIGLRERQLITEFELAVANFQLDQLRQEQHNKGAT